MASQAQEPKRDALSILDTIKGIAMKPESAFMKALLSTMPQYTPILPAQLMFTALTVIKASDTLQKCSEYSIFTSIAEVAQSGLSLDVHLGQAYLVPFSGQATVLYGYRGLQELARRSGEVMEIVGEIRYSKDKWKLNLGTNRELFHEPFPGPVSKRGGILGAYAVAEMVRGRPVFEYMDIEEIEKIEKMVLSRKRSDKPSPWETNRGEMIRKTPVRRVAKRLPQSPVMLPFIQASIRDEYRDAGQRASIDVQPIVADAIDAMDIQPDPPQDAPEPPAEQKESDIKEKPTEKTAETEPGISKNEVADVYVLMGDCKIESTEMPKILASIGHKGKLAELPKAKLKALLDKLQAGKR